MRHIQSNKSCKVESCEIKRQKKRVEGFTSRISAFLFYFFSPHNFLESERISHTLYHLEDGHPNKDKMEVCCDDQPACIFYKRELIGELQLSPEQEHMEMLGKKEMGNQDSGHSHSK